MRQSRRTNIGNRRDTLARRWRPWLPQDAPDPVADRPAAGPPLPVGGSNVPADDSAIRMTDDDRPR
jgi:hypothetical protein